MSISSMYDAFVNFLGNVTLFNGLSLVITIGSILLAFVFYFRSKKERKPLYAVRNVNLIKDTAQQIKGLAVSFNNQQIKNVSIARVAIWNAGRETIDHADIAAQDPFRIHTEHGAELLELHVIYEKNPASNFLLSPVVDLSTNKQSQKEFALKFDYIDYNEGAILQIFHTGQSTESIRVSGSVKGSGQIVRMESTFMRGFSDALSPSRLKRRHRRMAGAILLTIVPIFFFIDALHRPTISNFGAMMKTIGVLLITFLYWGSAISLYRNKLPRGFDLFQDEIKI